MARNKRFNTIISLIEPVDTLVDIGTDHGLVIKKAFELGLIKKAIAADINPKPLNQANENLKGYPVRFIVSDGFKNINENFDTAIIAGMGSHTIIDILKDVADLEATFILQPNDKIELLRAFLMDNNYKIVDEVLVHDKFYYIVLKVVRGKMNLTKQDLILGPVLINKKEAKEYYHFKLKQLNRIIKTVDNERFNEISELINIYTKGLDQ